MRIDILSLFPAMFQGPFSESILRRAADGGLVQIKLHQIRDYTTDKHRTTDDYPYGGGPGMVLKPEPLFAAVESVVVESDLRGPVILLSPQGRLLTQSVADGLARERRLVLICGHYEGVDERVREYLADDEISIGDYVLTGGELAAMVLVDVVVRCVPGVLGAEESRREESHAGGLLEYPHYTRPATFRDWSVPEVLLSGNHREIGRWRRRQSIERTLRRRPELLETAELSPAERSLVESLRRRRRSEYPSAGDWHLTNSS